MHRAMSRPSQPLCLWQGIGLLAALSAAACAAAAPSLEGGFRDPPASAKPQVWYHVMNGNATKAGVTRDFEDALRLALLEDCGVLSSKPAERRRRRTVLPLRWKPTYGTKSLKEVK